MRKRTRIAEPIKEEEFAEEDCISALPDHILLTILSRLTLKEVAVTSILSRQWRYLWTHVAGLNFDNNYSLDCTVADHKLRSPFINWVDCVLRQHRGPVVDDVRICFDLDKSSKRAVDNWVEFAIVKRVRRLELDLLRNGESLYLPLVRIGERSWYNNYTFPYELLSQSKGMSLNNIYSNYGLMQPSMLSCLEVLSLKSVNVSEEALDCFFSNCPVLNYLSIYGSVKLMNVKVSGLTLRLKFLEIVFCMDIETIEISNVNLVSFAYLGHGINLIICNVPMLDEISIGERYYRLGKNVFKQLFCCLHQLENLTLDIHNPEENRMVSAFPVLPNLKQLIVKVGPWNDESLLEFTSLIKACPNLNRFVLQLQEFSPLKRRKGRQGAKCKHAHLKSVEITGYYGRTSDAEAVMYFIENVVALETIVIDTRIQRIQRSPAGIAHIKHEELVRRRTREQLESKIPPGVQLIIL